MSGDVPDADPDQRQNRRDDQQPDIEAALVGLPEAHERRGPVAGWTVDFRWVRASGVRWHCAVDAIPERGCAGECFTPSDQRVAISLEPPLPGMLLSFHEAALALEAGPAAAVESASLYVFGTPGYERVRRGHNGFSCLVQRLRRPDLWPICYDPEGTRSLLPVDLLRGRLRAAGAEESVVIDSVNAGYREGRFRSAAKLGVAYMLSANAWTTDASGRPHRLPPHLMLYAPFATNAEFGIHDPDPGGFPLGMRVEGEGRPDAYLILRLPGDPGAVGDLPQPPAASRRHEDGGARRGSLSRMSRW